MYNKPNKSILGLSICLALGLSSESFAKLSVEAQKPSVQSISKADDNQLILSAGVFDPLYETLDFQNKKFKMIESSKYSIIQFQPGKADSEWLRRQGIQVVSYLPNNAFIIVNPKSNNKSLANNNIRWKGPYLSTYKVAPTLWQENLKSQGKYEIIVSFFNDMNKSSLKSLLSKHLSEANIEILNFGKNNDFKVTVNKQSLSSTIEKLSLIDSVKYIDLNKEVKLLNTEAVSAVQENQLSGSGPTNDNYTPSNMAIFDKGLVGSGQIVAVADSGLDSNEDWFVHYDNGTTVTHVVTESENTNPPSLGTLHPNNKVIGYFTQPGADAYDHADAGYHGTHVTGSVAGDRLALIGTGPAGSISSPNDPGYDNDDGMAPNAQILFQDIGSSESGTGLAAGYGPMYTQAYNAGARIHSNSYGSIGDGSYFFTDLWTDESLREHEDMLILFAAGNDDGDYNTTGSPGNGKNVTTVGALAHGNNPFEARFSNRGPTDDGRIKPDIMATGANIESASGNEDNSTTISPPGRSTKSGTSMATPVAAGASALMRQFYTDGFYPTGVANPADAHNPTGPLMKATLINGAGIDGGHFDKDIGWGRVYLTNSIMFNDSEKQMRAWEVINESGLKTGESSEFTLQVKAGQPLAVTLAWYDLPGPMGSGKTLINDLDLKVQINGQTYKGNVWSDIAVSGTGGEFDRLNTVEQIRIPSPVDGIYTISITGANIPGDGSINSFRQGFGLIATGNFDNLTPPAGDLGPISDLTSVSLEDNGTQISWSEGTNADFYEVYRVEGSCSSADFANARYVGNSETNTFTDFRSLNGKTYAYKVRSAQYGKLGSLSDSCTEITSQQACDFLPSFNESLITVVDNAGDTCHTELSWSAATANCPSSPNIKYNIYRSEDSDFLPSVDNLLTTVTTTSFDDIRAPDVPAYYIIRAEDNAPGGTGPNGGTETLGTSRIRSLAVGNGLTFSPVVEDVDSVSIMNLSFPWQVVSNNASSGSLSYKTGEAGANYPNNMCNYMTTNPISLDGVSNPVLEYNAQYSLEEQWDGVVVEISTDNGSTWSDFPPVGGYPSDLGLTPASPENGCGYPATQGAFSGSNGGFQAYSHDLSAYAGQEVKVRWVIASDTNTTEDGFYIDDINYPNVGLPNACTVNTAPDKPQPGLYYDKSRSGHGFVVEPIGNDDLYFTVFYTYKDDGTPEWYTSLANLENNVLNVNMDDGTLLRFLRDYNNNSNIIDTSIGTNILKIDFNSSSVQSEDACNDGTSRNDEKIALASWQIGDQLGDWCIEPLINAPPTGDLGGTWWAGSGDTGWGLSLSFAGDLIVVTIYYFDADGNPRWVQGVQSGFQVGQAITLDMNDYIGFGREDEATDLVGTIAGSLTMTLNSNDQGLEGGDGSLTMDVDYQGDEGGNWSRTDLPITIITSPH